MNAGCMQMAEREQQQDSCCVLHPQQASGCAEVRAYLLLTLYALHRNKRATRNQTIEDAAGVCARIQKRRRLLRLQTVRNVNSDEY